MGGSFLLLKVVIAKVRLSGCRRSPNGAIFTCGGFLPAVFAAALAVSLFCSSTVLAQDTDAATTLEYRMKAAYLLKFISFVTWPADAFAADDQTIVVAVVGDSPILRALAGIQGKKIRGYTVLVQHFRRPSDVTFSHILFIPSEQEKRIPEILASTNGQRTLTVSELENFIDFGGMINIYPEDNQFVFEINESAAKTVGLTIAPELLTLAR